MLDSHHHKFKGLVFILLWLFLSKVFLYVLSKSSYPTPLFPTNFVWKSNTPSKAKAFVWLVVHKMVNPITCYKWEDPTNPLVHIGAFYAKKVENWSTIFVYIAH